MLQCVTQAAAQAQVEGAGRIGRLVGLPIACATLHWAWACPQCWQGYGRKATVEARSSPAGHGPLARLGGGLQGVGVQGTGGR